VRFQSAASMKIYQIMEERKGTVHLTADQEEVYIQFLCRTVSHPNSLKRLTTRRKSMLESE
jgi:uncharacterized protein (DUF1778 family)